MNGKSCGCASLRPQLLLRDPAPERPAVQHQAATVAEAAVCSAAG